MDKLKDDSAIAIVAVVVVAAVFYIQSKSGYLLALETDFRRFYFEANVTRVLFMLASIGSGFLLGWYFSSNASEFRKYVFWTGSVVAFIIAASRGKLLGLSLTWLIAIIGFLVASSFWVGNILRRFGEAPKTFGSSRRATIDDLEKNKIYGKNGVLLGEALNKNGEPDAISYKSERHLLTVAPTRSGKGTTQIIPNLLTYEGLMLVIDPKGENALISAKRREEMGQ